MGTHKNYKRPFSGFQVQFFNFPTGDGSRMSDRRGRSKARRKAGRRILPVEVDEVGVEEMLRTARKRDGTPFLTAADPTPKDVADALGLYIEFLHTDVGDVSPRG